TGREEINVEGMQRERRQAGTYRGFAGRRQTVVEASIGRAVEPSVGFVDVGLVAGLNKNAAVARQAKGAEFEMEVAVAEFLMRDDAIGAGHDFERAVGENLPLRR